MSFSLQEERLCQRLGYVFKDPSLLTLALTHRSVGHRNNERLEFLGDALLGFAMAEVLFHRFPECDEGQLTRLRAALVKRETLARIARDLELGGCLRLGEGELKSGGFRRDSILANAVEAIIGAIYLDAGLTACVDRVGKIFAGALGVVSPQSVGKDPKTQLQEHLQSLGLALPAYRTVRLEGEPHAQQFTVECSLPQSSKIFTGHGESRRRAEQAAAASALDNLLSAGHTMKSTKP